MSCFLDICEHSSLKHQCNIQVVFVISFDLNTCSWHDFYLLHPQSICYTMSSQTCTDEYLIPNQKCIYLHARYHICKQGGCNDNAALFCYTSHSCEMKGICMWSALITGSQLTTLILQYNFPSILVITICFHILTSANQPSPGQLWPGLASSPIHPGTPSKVPNWAALYSIVPGQSTPIQTGTAVRIWS